MVDPIIPLLYSQVVAATSARKYQQIIQSLTEDIATGRYEPGQRLPSESELVATFGASRPTVNRALRELQLTGQIDRRAGSGSYVRADPAQRGYTFGLLIRDLGRTEIFEPICSGMAHAHQSGHHVLLWGSSLVDDENAEAETYKICRQLIAKKVSGVFFAPLELTPLKDVVNRAVVETFDKASIPVVLLDRDLVAYPARSKYDLVGIDNRRAGYTITAHLLGCGCRRVLFVGRPGSAPTVDARISGYREAMLDANAGPKPGYVCRIDPQDQAQVKGILTQFRPDGIVCANDFTAATLMRTFNEIGVMVPEHIRLAGIDDVKYASLVSVPLTTIHQPCSEVGAMAVAAMLERLRNPNLPARDILLDFRLVIRDSCGSRDRSASHQASV